MGVAWSHCPLCELKQVAWFPPTAQSTLPLPCAGALGLPPHLLPPATSALHQELAPNAPGFPHHPIPAQMCTGDGGVLCCPRPCGGRLQPHSAPC